MIVVGVSCGGVFVLCLLSVYVTRHYKKKGKEKCKAFLRRHSDRCYIPKCREVRNEREEDIAFIEKIGIWSEGKDFFLCV